MQSRPVREVENQEFRRISRHSVNVFAETLTEVLFKLVELEEKRDF